MIGLVKGQDLIDVFILGRGKAMKIKYLELVMLG